MQADSVLRAAQAELQRTQDLVARGFLSPARLDEAQRAAAVAQAQQTSARAQRSANADQGVDVAQAQAQLALAGSAAAAARARRRWLCLVPPCSASGEADLGGTCYQRWLSALETVVAAKGAATTDELLPTQRAWDHAADRTPHGQAISLQAGDFEG